MLVTRKITKSLRSMDLAGGGSAVGRTLTNDFIVVGLNPLLAPEVSVPRGRRPSQQFLEQSAHDPKLKIYLSV